MKKPFSNYFKKTPPIEVKQAPMIVPVSQGSFLEAAFSGSSISARGAMELYRRNSAVATAVDLIADSFEQIRPVLKVGDEFIKDHPVIDFLMNPNGFETWERFAGNVSRHYLLTHDSHISAVGNVKNKPIEAWSVPPQSVSVMQAADLYPARYVVSQGKGSGNYERNERARQTTRFIDPSRLKELYHIMGFSSRENQTSGDSPLQAAALDAKQQIATRLHNLKVVENGGRLSLVFSFKDTMDEKTHQERKDRIHEHFAGNAGAIAVVSSKDLTVSEHGTTNKDMDFQNMEETANRSIYMRYRVPLPLVTTDASTFNNFQSAVVALYDFAVLPLAGTIFGGLSMFLLPRYGLDPAKVEITYDPDTITALMDRRLDQLTKRKAIGIETTNELRQQLPNRGDIDNGDDVLVPANLVPLGQPEEVVSDSDADDLANDIDV